MATAFIIFLINILCLINVVLSLKTNINRLSMSYSKYRVLIHGGAGTISKNIDKSNYQAALKQILKNIYNYIQSNEQNNIVITPIDIVEYSVMQLEDCPLFNAGVGAVIANNGQHELDASIMDGLSETCGSTSYIKRIANPISLARIIMEKSNHNFIIGQSAELLGQSNGLNFIENSYLTTEARYSQWLAVKSQDIVTIDHNSEEGKGTVGCVCMYDGHIAAGTSTGGMTNKRSGRVGDSPVIGAGTYASDNTCAVSATGNGEEFIRLVVAYDIAARMSYKSLSISDAVKETVYSRLPHDSGGVIAIDKLGNYSMEFNSAGMYRGQLDSSGSGFIGIWEESEDFNF